MARTFPSGFLWGAATSAHQVEGNCTNNQWWAWEQEAGHIRDGAVSGLASCFPDAIVPLVRDRTAIAQEKATALRASLQRLPFHAAAKTVLGLRGVPVEPEVRAPLRGLTDVERAEVQRIVEEWG